MPTEPTIDECLGAIVAKDEEIGRLQSLVSTLKSASNELRRCLANFSNEENWEVKVDSEGEAMEWRWLRGHPSLLAYRALLGYDAALKSWDDSHPTGAERLRLQ